MIEKALKGNRSYWGWIVILLVMIPYDREST